MYTTKTIKSSDLGQFCNDLDAALGDNWSLFHISHHDSGYVSYVTYKVEKPKDNAPAPAEDVHFPSLGYRS
jgi:hypothetical protein